VLACLALLPWTSLSRKLAAETRLPRPLTRFIAGAAKALAAARSLLTPGVLLIGFALGLVAWGLEGLGLYALGSMLPAVHLAPATGVGIYAVAVLVGALSLLPGGLGSTETVMTALLATQGYALGDALLITILCRIVTLWLAVCIGWLAVFVLRQKWVPMVSSWP
jgi:glycosyltransferase 2 family protein